MKPVGLCVAMKTYPNLPLPSCLPIWKSERERGWGDEWLKEKGLGEGLGRDGWWVEDREGVMGLFGVVSWDRWFGVVGLL